MAFAIVAEDARSTADRIDNQIQGAVAVEVGERGPGRVQVVAGHAGARGDVLKLPIAQVAIKRAGAADVAEEEIAPAVAIHVSRRHAGAVEQNLIGQMPLFRQKIRECDSRG